jgi:Calx-beta domain
VTVDESATAGSDYRASFGTLTIPAGFTSAFVSVDVYGDLAFEGDESFRLELFDAVNSVVGPALGTNAGRGTIVSDDLCASPPTINPNSFNLTVAGGNRTIAVADPLSCGWKATSSTPWLTITGTPNCPAGSPPSCLQGGTGSGNVQISVAPSTALVQRLAQMSVANLPVTVVQDGVQCNFTLSPTSINVLSSGTTGSLTVNATNAICDWTAASNAPWLLITTSPACPPGSVANCAHGGRGSGVVNYTVQRNEGVDRGSSITAGATPFVVNQLGFFFDEFDNGVLSPFWTYSNAAMWSESNSRLIGVAPAGQSAKAIARPAFDGCIQCTITTKVRFEQFGQGTATLYAWYLDAGNNVELTINEFANEWVLKQVKAGVTVANTVLTRPTVTGQDYTVQLEFDGTEIRLSIDGSLAVVMAPAVGATPDGTVGFRVDSNAASFDLIKVVSVTGSITRPDELFANNFE